MATKRSTSTTANVENVAAALDTLEPPVEAGKMSKKEHALFDIFVRGKAASDWFDHELVQVVQLAKLTQSLIENKDELEIEGDIVYNSRGTQICNPRFNVVNSLISSQLALMRSLNLAASKTQKKEQITHRAGKQKETRQKVGTKTPLLAVPTKQ